MVYTDLFKCTFFFKCTIPFLYFVTLLFHFNYYSSIHLIFCFRCLDILVWNLSLHMVFLVYRVMLTPLSLTVRTIHNKAIKRAYANQHQHTQSFTTKQFHCTTITDSYKQISKSYIHSYTHINQANWRLSLNQSISFITSHCIKTFIYAIRLLARVHYNLAASYTRMRCPYVFTVKVIIMHAFNYKDPARLKALHSRFL